MPWKGIPNVVQLGMSCRLVVFYVFQTQRYHLQRTRAALNSIHTVLCPVSLVWHLNFLSSHIACMPLTIDRRQCQTCCGLWIIYTNVCQLYLAQEIIHSTHIGCSNGPVGACVMLQWITFCLEQKHGTRHVCLLMRAAYLLYGRCQK